MKTTTGNGGTIYLDAALATLEISGSTVIEDSEATLGRGGLIYVNKALSI